MTDGLKDKYRQAIVEILAANPRVERAVLFGSRAMGTFTTTSDVDIALFGDALTLTDHARLAEAMDELVMPQRVDIVLHSTIRNKGLLKHIERHGVEWYRRGGGTGCEWMETILGDLVELKRGYDLPKRKRKYGSVPIVSSSGITDYHSEAKIKGPGVVTGRYGTLGRVFYVREDFWPLNTTLYVRDFKGSDPKFISYFLRTINYLAYSDKAAVPGLNRNHLHMARVLFPADLAQQRAIAQILGSLDDKIELNRQMNETLEAMARAIFKSWFVDFDPVRAKAEGRDAGLPDEIAGLFPDSFEESELGEIPNGWEVKTIGDVAEFAYGKALKASDRKPGDVPVFGSNGQVGLHNEALVKGPGIVIGRKGNPGIVTWSYEDFFPIDTTFYVKRKKVISSLNYLFYALKAQDLKSLSADSAVPGLNRNLAYMSKFLVPSEQVLTALDDQIDPFFQTICANEKEMKTIAILRDTLLPKLISGELRVPDAEKFIEEAGV